MSWKRNLAVIWLAQFLAISGFAFAMPFAPFFIQELGITDPTQLKIWVAAFAAATPLALTFAAPIWGALADRYGRRVMLLRANFAAAIILMLMSQVDSVQGLIFLRLLQGLFTGTVTASQTLLATSMPSERSGLALGGLSSAVFTGMMAGASMGGFVAEWFGYRVCFIAAGSLTFAAGLLVLFCSKEDFVKPTEPWDLGLGHMKLRWSHLMLSAPILLIITSIAFVRHFDLALMPLLVQDIHGSIVGASAWTGGLAAVAGTAGLLSGIILGRLADRFHPPKLGMASALGAGLLMLPHGLARGFLLLFTARFGMIFCSGGLDPVFQIWLAKVTPPERRGFVFGWAASARSIGWVGAGLASGAVATLYGIRAIYFVGGALFLLLIPLIKLTMNKIDSNGAET